MSATAPRARGEQGLVLVYVLLVGTVLTTLAFGLSVLAQIDTQIENAEERALTNFYAAEGALNHAIASFQNVFLNFQTPRESDRRRTLTIGNLTARYEVADVAGPDVLALPSGDPFAGLYAIRYQYAVDAFAVGENGRDEARLAANFDVANIPLFQFVAFYAGDLEILPGANMTLVGRIHTNGDLYLNAFSTSTLAIEDAPAAGIPTVQVSAGGSLFRGRSAFDDCFGRVVIDEKADADESGDQDPLELPCGGPNRRRVPASDLAAWGGNVSTGVRNIAVPAPSLVARLSTDERGYWRAADLRLVLRLDQTAQIDPAGPLLQVIEAQNPDGSRDVAATNLLWELMRARPGKVFYTAVPSCGPIDPAPCADRAVAYAPPFANDGVVYRRADDAGIDAGWSTAQPPGIRFDYRRGGFWDWRERAWRTLLNVDVQALLAWNAARPAGSRFFDPADTSDGGIVLFLSVQGPLSAGANAYGVRVFDSVDLPFPTTASADPTGLTVVSDQAVFVQGHYNAGNVDPAAILGDTVNVLSERWEQDGRNDAKTRQSLDHAARDAADTIVHAAFVSGVPQTAPGAYNGGYENYPRFHEDWQGPGATFTYRGSFVSLGVPQHTTSAWCLPGGTSTWVTGPSTPAGCNVYTAPNRAWTFETAFLDAARLPPLDPRFVYVQQNTFAQEFR